MLVATVTTQRSGSKLLGSCFNQGTVVRSFGEMFNPDASHAVGAFTEFVGSLEREVRKHGSDAIMDLYFSRFKFIHGVIHFDLMFNQVEIPCVSWNPYDDHFVYGYLRARNAVIISLERNLHESYISGKYLQLTADNKAHHFSAAETAKYAVRNTLDVQEYRRYCQAVTSQRQRLYDSMRDYENFVRCSYSDLALRCRLPDEVIEVIHQSGRQHGISINRDMVQLLPPPIVPTGANYREVFENIDEIESEGVSRSAS